MKERIIIDDRLCRKVQLMLGSGASAAEVAELTGVSAATVSRIRKAGYSAAQYAENTKVRMEMERRKPEQEEQAEEQVPGQIEMDLIRAAEKPAEMSEQTKMMRFQAAQVDKICVKLDHINDTLCQILRVMRKE